MAFTATANFHLHANVDHTLPGVNGSADLGRLRGVTNMSWTDATIFGQFLVTATGATDVATLTFSSGAVAQTTGTPTITGADASNGQDFEGVNHATLATLYAVMYEVVADGVGDITTDSIDFGGKFNKSTDGGIWWRLDGVSIASDTLTVDLDAIGASVRVSYLGKA